MPGRCITLAIAGATVSALARRSAAAAVTTTAWPVRAERSTWLTWAATIGRGVAAPGPSVKRPAFRRRPTLEPRFEVELWGDVVTLSAF